MHIIMLQNKTQNISIVKLRPVDHFAQRLHYSIFNLSIPGSIIFNLIISYNNLIVYRANCFYHRPSDTWFIISIHNFVDAILCVMMISSPSNFSCRIHRFHILCTEVHFLPVSFPVAVIKPPEKKLAKRTSEQSSVSLQAVIRELSGNHQAVV